MKDFLKYTLATITGIVVILLIVFFSGLVILFSALSPSNSETRVEKNSVMALHLNGVIEERSTSDPWSYIMGNTTSSIGLNDILTSIKKAKENDKIKGIYILGTSTLSASPSSLQEIHDALIDFKESGKFIVSYADNYSQGSYYLASVADKVMMNPQGMLEWQGMELETMFYKELLDKVGVEMQVFKVGTYKSAVEPYILNEMSDANREQLTEIVNSIWNNITEDVSESRHLSKEKLNELADKVLMFHPATEAVSNGMLDTLIYKNDVRDYLKKMAGIDQDANLHLLGISEMVNVNRNVPKDKSGNIIAVYYAAGEIDGTSIVNIGSSSGINSEKVISDLRKLKEDKDVKAVVLRVNSPGGSAYGSEQIWYAIKQLKEEKPVIVSMGDYAASGGYYISCGSDLIVAEPTTLTGSIGIFGLIPNAQKLKEKFGVNIQSVKTNEHADIQSTEMLTRPMTESEKGLMQMYVNNGYDLFTTRVADGRNLSKTRVDEIGQGRVWTGERAKELGLVDELGGIDKAISIAVERAGIEKYTLLTYPEGESMLSKLMNNNPTKYVRSSLLKSKFGDLYYQYEFVNNFSINDMLQMRMPYELDIH
ncbi:MAG: signal peptide peptidase SppA [Bacteroidaceae bacterium]|nr:signal peptide peptidase SppA [Bacteroidaceae bacterium]